MDRKELEWRVLIIIIIIASFLSGVIIGVAMGTKRGNTIVKIGDVTHVIPYNTTRTFTLTPKEE